MTESERLIDLILSADISLFGTDKSFAELYADDLIENGVIVLPCKLGDMVYRISTKSCTKMKYIQKTKVSRIAIDNDGTWIFCECNPISKCVFGKTVFLTKEEAEKALKGR